MYLLYCFHWKTLLFFTIFVTFGMEGVPLGKRFKKGCQKCRPGAIPKSGYFVQREAFGPLSKKINFLDTPKTAQKRHLDAQRGQTNQKAAFGGIFGTFVVPCQQWKACSRLGGSLIFEVPGYPKTGRFSWFFGIRQKEPPGNHFWRTFWDLGRFLRIFGFPLGSNSEHGLLKFVLKITAAKK